MSAPNEHVSFEAFERGEITEHQREGNGTSVIPLNEHTHALMHAAATIESALTAGERSCCETKKPELYQQREGNLGRSKGRSLEVFSRAFSRGVSTQGRRGLQGTRRRSLKPVATFCFLRRSVACP